MVCMERRLGGKEGGRRRSRQREAAAAAGRAEVARSACTNRTMELPPQKGRDPLFARDGARRDALGLTHSSPASRARTPAAMQRQAARQRGSSMGGGWAGRWVGGKERRNRRKAGECGTRRVGPYAAAPNTDNAGRSGNQRRQASASGQRGKAAACGSEQWWHKRARRRDSGSGAGGSNGGSSGVHSVISSNSVSFIGVTSLIPKTSVHSSVQSVIQSVRQSSPAPAPNVVMSRKSLPASVMMMMTTMPNPRRQQQQRWRSQRSSGGGGGSSSQ